MLDTGVAVLPKLPRDAGDRNRTSPFAFTGNKFEFRAVSSNQSIAFPNIALNVAVTESLDYMATELESGAEGAARSSRPRSRRCCTKMIKENKRIIFNGNGYSDEWQKEAAKRGLLNLTTHRSTPSPSSLKPDVDRAVREVRRPQRARSARALRGRARAATTRPINIEAQLMVLMANRYILPAGVRVSEAARRRPWRRSRRPGPVGEGDQEAARRDLRKLTDALQVARRRAPGAPRSRRRHGDAEKHAKYFRDKVRAGDGRAARGRRRARRARAPGRLAAADLPRDAVHPVDPGSTMLQGAAPSRAAPFFSPPHGAAAVEVEVSADCGHDRGP